MFLNANHAQILLLNEKQMWEETMGKKTGGMLLSFVFSFKGWFKRE